MFHNVAGSIQKAFFDSIEKVGCLQLDTEGPASDSESEEEEGEDFDGDGSTGGEDEEDEDSEEEGSEGESDSEHAEYDVSTVAREVEMSSLEAAGVSTAREIVGFGSFLRKNPRTDKFAVEKVHHVELWCSDAVNTASRFSWALGIPMAAKSDLSTGNPLFTSYALRSADVTLCFSAPQSAAAEATLSGSPKVPFPSFDREVASDFIVKHGLAVRAIAVEVGDVKEAYDVSIRNGADKVAEPVEVCDPSSSSSFWVAEVLLFGDVVLRFIKSSGASGPFLPTFSSELNSVLPYGLTRLDHAVGAVSNLQEALSYITGFTGFHLAAEPSAEPAPEKASTADRPAKGYDILFNNSESVVLPFVAPGLHNDKVQRYLEKNDGPGILHLAFSCTDIVRTVREMKARSQLGGLHFLPAPPPSYYEELKLQTGLNISKEQLDSFQELGISVGVDERGVLLQILSTPVGDRPTFAVEVVQRISHQGAAFSNVGCGELAS